MAEKALIAYVTCRARTSPSVIEREVIYQLNGLTFNADANISEYALLGRSRRSGNAVLGARGDERTSIPSSNAYKYFGFDHPDVYSGTDILAKMGGLEIDHKNKTATLGGINIAIPHPSNPSVWCWTRLECRIAVVDQDAATSYTYDTLLSGSNAFNKQGLLKIEFGMTISGRSDSSSTENVLFDKLNLYGIPLTPNPSYASDIPLVSVLGAFPDYVYKPWIYKPTPLEPLKKGYTTLKYDFQIFCIPSEGKFGAIAHIRHVGELFIYESTPIGGNYGWTSSGYYRQNVAAYVSTFLTNDQTHIDIFTNMMANMADLKPDPTPPGPGPTPGGDPISGTHGSDEAGGHSSIDNTPVANPDEASVDGASDTISSPTTPTSIDPIFTNLVTAYAPTTAETMAFASELWSDNFITQLKKLFNNPMEAIISFGSIPVAPTTESTASAIKVGNYTFTNANAKKITSNFITFDCGEMTIPHKTDSFMDYEPYTKIQIVLPYIGSQNITPTDVLGKEMNLKYKIDVLTGACAAILSVEGTVLYQWFGNVFSSIPLSSSDKSALYGSITKAVTNIVSGAVTGAAGGIGGMIAGGASGALSSVGGVVSSKQSDVQKTGASSSQHGLLGVRTPYIIMEYPYGISSIYQKNTVGMPFNKGGKLSDFSGYMQIREVHLENVAATSDELTEIEELLKGGVILS